MTATEPKAGRLGEVISWVTAGHTELFGEERPGDGGSSESWALGGG